MEHLLITFKCTAIKMMNMFGGTANVKHAVLTNNDDDDIDFDEGYQGNISTH